MDEHPIIWAFRKLTQITITITVIILIFWIWEKLTPIETKTIKSHWVNEDPSKSVTDIQYLNYETGEVTYRKYRTASREPKVSNSKLSTTNIVTSSGDITIELTPEEIIQQLNIDYEDIRDYYGDELK